MKGNNSHSKHSKVNSINQKHKKHTESDEEEESVDQDNYEKDGFVVDDENEEGDLIEQPEENYGSDDDELASSDMDLDDTTKKKRIKKAKIDDDYKEEEDSDKNSFIEPTNVVKKKPKSRLTNRNNDIYEEKSFLKPKTFVETTEILSKVFQKEELEEAFMTEKDNKILIEDTPERLQLLYSNEELKAYLGSVEPEAEWLLEKLKLSNRSGGEISKSSTKSKIIWVLEAYKRDKFDIPYIIYYQKNYYDQELSAENIWKIIEYDQEWAKLLEYRIRVKLEFQRICMKLDDKIKDFIEWRYIDGSKSIKDLQNVENIIAYYKEAYDNEEINEGYKKPIKRSIIKDVIKTRLNELISYFVIPPSEFSSNLDIVLNSLNDRQMFIPRDLDGDLNTLIKKYLPDSFYEKREREELIKACQCTAYELFAFPPVRVTLLIYMRNHTKLSTSPTPKGLNELDIFHPAFKVKRLENKPVNTFDKDLFLEIYENKRLHLINYKIEIPSKDLIHIKDQLKRAYLRPGNYEEGTKLFKLNQVREEIINSLIQECATPALIKDVTEDLLKNSENYIIKEASNAFYNLLMTGPYKLQEKKDILLDDDVPRVFSFVYDNFSNIVYLAALDEFGEVLYTATFNYLNNKIDRKNVTEIEKVNYFNEKNELQRLIKEYSPHLFVIGANHIKCLQLMDQLKQKEESNKASDVWETFGDLTIPKIFSTSQKAEKKYKNFNIFLRQAISLGRFKQNPLAEVLNLWNENPSKNLVLSINLHHLQKYVNQTRLHSAFEIEAIKVVNRVGVEINRIYDHDHLQNPLMFISGLGPRKANKLINEANISKGFVSRNQMSLVMTKNIYINSSGFIKVKVENIDSDVNLLDLTRIHYDHYSLPLKIIESTLDDNKSKDSRMVEKFLRDPKKLMELDLINYKKKLDHMAWVVDFITAELNHPFKDPRPSHSDILKEDLFRLLTSESPIEKGNIVLAKVTKITPKHVYCRIDNDIEATIWENDIYDENTRETRGSMSDIYKENMLIQARVKSINYTTFKVDLSTKPSEMKTHQKVYDVQSIDAYFRTNDAEDFINKGYYEDLRAEKSKFIKRNINHPHFKNLKYIQSIEFLKDKEIGEYVFRPNSTSPNNLTLSWKFYRNTFSQINIIEENKPRGASIGEILIISGEQYSSLQEIADRYVKPCSVIVKESLENRKFLHCDTFEFLTETLKKEKDAVPDIVHYFFTVLPNYPQYIIIAYIPKQGTVYKEFIRVKPQGLYFHNNFFKNLNELIIYFKENYSKDEYKSFAKHMKPPKPEERNKSDQFGEHMSVKSDNDQELKSLRSFNSQASKKCYICGKVGHLKNDCTEKFLNNKRSRDSEENKGRKEENEWNSFKGTYGSQNKSNTTHIDIGGYEKRNDKLQCHHCKEFGHRQNDCNQKDQRGGRSIRSDSDYKVEKWDDLPLNNKEEDDKW